jgi:hypothetical protein
VHRRQEQLLAPAMSLPIQKLHAAMAKQGLLQPLWRRAGKTAFRSPPATPAIC